MNETKTEIICENTTDLPASFSVFKRPSKDTSTLLGSPLTSGDSLTNSLQTRLKALELAASRLEFLHTQDALIILKHSLSVPSLMHIMRTTWCGNHPALDAFDRHALTHN